jgi:hypothetical protein
VRRRASMTSFMDTPSRFFLAGLLLAACTVPTREIHPVDDGIGGSAGTPAGTGGAGPGTGGGAGANAGGTAGASPTGGSGGASGSTGTGGTGGAAGKDAGDGTGGAAGSAGKGGGPGTGGTSGSSGSSGSGGAAGGSPPPDAAPPTCAAETPTGATMCGSNMSCLIATCGPPATYGCYGAGAGGDGATCELNADCASAAICLGYTDTLAVCRRTCAADTDCASNFRCTGSFTSCMGAIPGNPRQRRGGVRGGIQMRRQLQRRDAQSGPLLSRRHPDDRSRVHLPQRLRRGIFVHQQRLPSDVHHQYGLRDRNLRLYFLRRRHRPDQFQILSMSSRDRRRPRVAVAASRCPLSFVDRGNSQ